MPSKRLEITLKCIPTVHSKCPYRTYEVTQMYLQSVQLISKIDPEVPVSDPKVLSRHSKELQK